jgi:hypothetical protein
MPVASGVDAAFVALLAAHVPLDCLVDCFGMPLRRFSALVPLDSRLRGSRSCRTGLLRARLVAAALRERLLADNELFADCRRRHGDDGGDLHVRHQRRPRSVGHAAVQGLLGD